MNRLLILQRLTFLIVRLRYSEAVKRLSSMLCDQPQTPLERSIYWTEFYIRHKQVPHLRLGSRHLAPYQRALVDVYAVLMAAILFPFILLGLLIRRCYCNKNKVAETKSKMQGRALPTFFTSRIWNCNVYAIPMYFPNKNIKKNSF